MSFLMKNSTTTPCAQQRHRRGFPLSYVLVSIFIALAASFAPAVEAADDPAVCNLLDAREREVFSIGDARGTVIPTFDEATSKDVLEFDYSITRGSAIGISMKNFPPALDADQVNTAKIGVMVPHGDQVNQISVTVELKGTKDIQSIPLQIKRGWNSLQESVNWESIGELNEIAFVVNTIGGKVIVDGEVIVDGTLYLALDFVKLTPSYEPSALIEAPSTAEVPSSFNLLDAQEREAFSFGDAQSTVIPTFDEVMDQDVLEFDYSAAKGSVTGVLLKNFPPALDADQVNTAKIGVLVPHGDQVNQISVTVELKGTKDVQTIPLQIKRGWNSVQELIHWEKIGDLNEAAFIVNALGGEESAEGEVLVEGEVVVGGTLQFALDFVKPAPLEKTTAAPAEPASFFTLLDARKREVFKTGSAKGSILSTFDAVVEKDVLEFDYSVAKGSTIGISAKKFPSALEADRVNTAKIGIRLPNSDPVNQTSMKIELRGKNDTQSIPLHLKSGWNSIQEAINWEKIGDLKEVAFVVNAIGDEEFVNGLLQLSLDFVKLTPSYEPSTLTKTFPASFGLLDAGVKGVFNIGEAQGTTSITFDEAAQKDVLAFDYSAAKGTHVGVWTQEFPPELSQDTVDAVRIGIKAPNPDQVNQVAVKLEIKSENNWQTIPLRLKPGWNYFQELINWSTVGELKEVVFVVSPMGVGPTVLSPMGGSPVAVTRTEKSPMEAGDFLTGTLYFDIDFGQLTFMQKNFTFVKVGLVLLLSILLSLFLALLGKRFGQTRTSDPLKPTSDEHSSPASPKASVLSGLKRDFFNGVAAILIAGVAFWIYSLGTVGCLDAGFNFSFLAIASIGTAIAQLLKFNLTGKHLTPGEVFRNILLTGILAASSNRQALWQAPATWVEVLMISNLTAALVFLIYYISNAYALASSNKHLKTLTGILIVAVPYLFGWLLLLQNVTLLQTLANGISGGLLAASPAILEGMGRVLVIFGFNEAFANGISLVTSGRTVKTLKAHLLIFLVSLGVVAAPLIADWGSTTAVASLPLMIRVLVALLTTMLSFAGLWGEVYLITGIALDGGHRTAPSQESIFKHVTSGMKKGAFYSGYLITLLYALSLLLGTSLSQTLMASFPIAVGILAGALIFPLLKTIIETFDGSMPFFERVRYSYRSGTLYIRGAVVGFGFAHMITQGMFQEAMSDRIIFGLIIGLLASAGVSIFRDALYVFKGQGRIQSWRLYLTDSLLGIFVGSAAAFYLDARQVPVIVEKFKLYTSSGFSAMEYITYPLVNKWGRIDLGTYTGGVKLLFTESLAGVINWSIAAWLFAINKVFLQAFFEKHTAPIKFFFSKAGFAILIEHMIYVLRWGLWMSPIIFTFLRMMPDPTWYNQDGAIRTIFAIYHNATLSPEAFQAWSLKLFVWVLAFDFFRVLIWMDHMGLRVATLVNLSFIGLDKLDERISRWIGPAAAQRYIPEAVKRFATWGPLLIPFYLPRGRAWDYAWNTSESMQNMNGHGGLLATLQSMSFPQMLVFIGSSILVCAGISFGIRAFNRRSQQRREKVYKLGNREYGVVLKGNGEAYSEVYHKKSDVFPKEYDVSRRSYDIIDPCGRILYLVDSSQWHKSAKRSWPVIGNFPKESFEASRIVRGDDSLKVINNANGIRTTIEISLPDEDSTAEIWEVTVENLTPKARDLKVVPYLEWVLNGGLHDRFHTQYARLFPEMEYVSGMNAILSWQKSTKSMGILAVDVPPEGFLTSRMDFIGRARSIWKPRILETLDFSKVRDTAAYPTFDPIGSLMVDTKVNPKASKTMRFMIGYATNREKAIHLIQKHLKPHAAQVTSSSKSKEKKKLLLIGHGEILPGTPQPYSEFIDHGNKLLVHTPYTPRPFDHAMSNAVHSVMVTNRGLHTSCNGNSQQNRLTPDWPDTVTKEVPAEAIYLYDPDRNEWFSPTHHPLNEYNAKNESEFGVDGTAVFRMTHGTVSTELTVFVPPDDPTGIYLLTVKNNASHSRRMRIAPFFQMVLEFQPERSGELQIRYDKALDALFFENPRTMFRRGWAFATMTIPAERVETKRGRFFGTGRGVQHPYLVEKGEPDTTQFTDDRQIAGFLGTLEIPANGERTVAFMLGQTDERKDARRLVQKYKDIQTVRKSLETTRQWWLNLMGTVEFKTNRPEFDQLQNWLKYQAIAERIWPRRGFYQTSGAFGFRDQLQDTVNLLWVDPALARKQILLHASHQFIEGDVFHWFFTLTDGRTAFSCRSHASDSPLWLSWGVTEYLKATGDDSILDEMTSYVVSEFPFAKLPKNKGGWGHLYHRSTRADSVYRHCMKSIDLVLVKRKGKNGLPLIQTGDWNDGLDEIGSEGKGESVWLGFFLYYILKDMIPTIEKKEGLKRKEYYLKKLRALENALERTWREDRYLRAFHDDGTEIGVKDSGIWETDALTAAWAVMCGINAERGLTVFNTALQVLERENLVLLGWPALREDSKPYLGRSSKYPEGVRENGMYCHGVQWLIKAARILVEQFESEGDLAKADEYREITYRLWRKITPVSHVTPQEIECYGGQPNKQPADILTTYDQGRMIWNGYTGAAGWLFRQSLEGVIGASLIRNEIIMPDDLNKPRGPLKVSRVHRDLGKSPLNAHPSFPKEPSEIKVSVSPPEVTTDVK